MKKLIILIVIVVMVAILLCAFGAKKQEEDPTMAAQTIHANADTQINSYFADTNYSTDDSSTLGYSDSGPQKKRMLLSFDLSSIPSNAIITEAQLYMRQTYTLSTTTGIVFDIYRVTGAVNYSTVTWNTRPAVEGTPTITGLTCAHTTERVWRNWNVTNLVTEMIANSADSMMLRLQDESGAEKEQRFLTLEFSVSDPYLLVTYLLPIKTASNEGALSKTVQDVKRYDGTSWKTGKGIKIVSTQGPFNKTVF